MLDNARMTGNTLTLWFVLRLFSLCGFVVGIISIPFVIQGAFGGGPVWHYLVAIIAAPLINGVFAAIAGAIGYPIYAALAKRGHFKLDVAR
jgi:hypothetical protein